MIIACLISGSIGACMGVVFMALFIAGANEDRYMEMEARKKCRTGAGNDYAKETAGIGICALMFVV